MGMCIRCCQILFNLFVMPTPTRLAGLQAENIFTAGGSCSLRGRSFTFYLDKERQEKKILANA